MASLSRLHSAPCSAFREDESRCHHRTPLAVPTARRRHVMTQAIDRRQEQMQRPRVPAPPRAPMPPPPRPPPPTPPLSGGNMDRRDTILIGLISGCVGAGALKAAIGGGSNVHGTASDGTSWYMEGGLLVVKDPVGRKSFVVERSTGNPGNLYMRDRNGPGLYLYPTPLEEVDITDNTDMEIIFGNPVWRTLLLFVVKQPFGPPVLVGDPKNPLIPRENFPIDFEGNAHDSHWVSRGGQLEIQTPNGRRLIVNNSPGRPGDLILEDVASQRVYYLRSENDKVDLSNKQEVEVIFGRPDWGKELQSIQ